MKDVDCIFLCKTWLRPNQLHVVTSNMNKMYYRCGMKSGINGGVILEWSPIVGLGSFTKIYQVYHSYPDHCQ